MKGECRAACSWLVWFNHNFAGLLASLLEWFKHNYAGVEPHQMLAGLPPGQQLPTHQTAVVPLQWTPARHSAHQHSIAQHSRACLELQALQPLQVNASTVCVLL